MSPVSCFLQASVGGDPPEGLRTVGDYPFVPQMAIIGYSWSGTLLLAQALLEVILPCQIQAS
jgi:hypothetical protein